MDEHQERELVLLAQGGDRKALDDLFREHYKTIFALVLRLTNPDKAPDLTQEVFIKAFKGLTGFRAQSRFRTWVTRIAVRVAVASWRVKEASPPPVRIDQPERPESGIDLEAGLLRRDQLEQFQV